MLVYFYFLSLIVFLLDRVQGMQELFGADTENIAFI